MKKTMAILSVFVGGCSGFQAPTVVNVNANGGSSTTPVTLSQTNGEMAKEPGAGGSQSVSGSKSEDCGARNVICAYQGKGYENADIELTLRPRDIGNDGTATLDMKIPGEPFVRGRSVRVGDSWTFEANDKAYRLTILNMVMDSSFNGLGGYIKFKLTN